ncbi:unnamed protein product [Phaeothamnion confervicola]
MTGAAADKEFGEGGLDLRLSQCFGDCSPAEDVTEADILSTVQFDQTGEFLATGDRGGRVVIFRQNSNGRHKVCTNGRVRRVSDYKFYTEFQSHEAEFDYLKSLEIEEKINQIKWCARANTALFLISTNDKTVKLWKVGEKQVKRVATMAGPPPGGGAGLGCSSGSNSSSSSNALRLPTVTVAGSAVAARARKVYANAHAYHINSINPNSDGEHFISADDLRINLWNLDITDRSFNIVDIKPKNMEELTEVITSAAFHPTECHTFLYSTSRGAVKVGDMRQSALCDRHAKVLEEKPDPGTKSFFSEIVASISDIKTTQCGRYVVTRDYMTVKLWDLQMESRPVRTIPVHEHLRPRLCELYENDCIFDKFELAVSGDARYVVTGSYDNNCLVYDRAGRMRQALEVSKDPPRRGGAAGGSISGGIVGAVVAGPSGVDFEKKVLHMSWHPRDDIVAVAGLNKLYIYAAPR